MTIEHLLSHRSGIGDYLDEEAHRRHHRLRPAGARARARDDRAVPRGARRSPHRVPAGRAVRLLQRRLRRAGADRRADERHAVRRARASARVRAGWHGRHRVPALGRAPGRRRDRVPDGRRAEDERVPSAGARRAGTAGSPRRPPTFTPCGRRSSPGGSCRRTGWRRWCGRAATCRPSRCATASASGSIRQSDVVELQGYDAGVSFRSTHDPASKTTCTVISNTPEGTWLMEGLLDELMA